MHHADTGPEGAIFLLDCSERSH